ncbi:MAG: hypothetical protein H6732_04465 [Alphaproteobacteria bacterium]|nr:hypothetical protein [Alphaproteobacteria bacterium]
MARLVPVLLFAVLAACGGTTEEPGVCADRGSSETCRACCEVEGYAGHVWTEGSTETCECVSASDVDDTSG